MARKMTRSKRSSKTVRSGKAATVDQNPSTTTKNNDTVQNPYQLLLDRSKENGHIIDIRVAVIGAK
jgi:mitochondrial fission protein ELM1